MNYEKPNKYEIIYSNYLEFESRILAFRKRELFDITEMPIHIPFNFNCNCWIVNRKQLTKSKASELLIHKQKIVDITVLQWYQQEQLNHVFNL